MKSWFAEGGTKELSRNGILKQRARTTLLGHWGEHITYSLLLISLELLAGMVTGLITPAGLTAVVYTLLISLILQLLLGLFYDGALLHFLKTLRGEPSPIQDAFVPLRTQPDRYLIVDAARLAVAIILYLPIFFSEFIVPDGTARLIFILVWIVAGSVLYLVITAPISMARFLLMENSGLGAMQALKDSAELMRGQGGRYVKLILSFAGFILLAACTAGIGFVWVLPYMLTSLAAFYDDLKGGMQGSSAA